MQLNYKVLGEGKPLIIMHGIFGLMDNWMGLSKVLSQNYKVYLLDLRNHGRSPHSDEFDYEAMSQDLRKFMEEHAIENPHIIGHSMGGKVAMYFAGRFQPELFDKMVIVDIAPKYYPVHHRSILDALQSIDLQSLQSRTQADEVLAHSIPEMDVRQFLLKNLYRKDEGGFGWRFNLNILNQEIENVGEGLPEHFYSERPFLFIRGGLSHYIKDGDMDLILKHFPNAHLETVAGAGHWVHAEKPEELLTLVQDFIR
ncbi:alpha/beta fold hydrolase [Cytophagaceae bacterium YF14B1]|uniref:Alpha/beta fold hydrolase n=1 Tax=Xanthocytophaga flava TaxID=3048013 RepID=A0AAE3U4I9_9BACT|nr:alpha/beta fold hydrolase [Xanthocytophaga flavus]MDJ1479311.1 alpha/beta fold hydrolase [Xanthocytophaga flavus]